MKPQTPVDFPLLSRIQLRVAFGNSRLDYLIAFLFAAWPILLSRILELHNSGPSDTLICPDFWPFRSSEVPHALAYRGFWCADNFTSLALILPGALWVMRWAMRRIAPIREPWSPVVTPPVIALIETDSGRREAYDALRRAMLDWRILAAALVCVVLFHVQDLWVLLFENYRLAMFGQGQSTEDVVGWARLFMSTSITIQWEANLLLAIFAYGVQFAVLLLGFVFGFLLAVHNWFFLRRIYQRSQVPDGKEDAYIQIDLTDGDRCFGFREANDAFNTQVRILIICGITMLLSRFENTTTWAEFLSSPGSIFPNWSQAIMAGSWLVLLAIVSMPALVKLLPRLPLPGNERASRTITSYMREFMPPGRWPFGREPSEAEIEALAAHFARNAFWPTGNNRASQLFFFSIWIGLVVFFTLPVDDPRARIGLLLLMGGVAYLGQKILFSFLSSSLEYIDHRLVEVPPGETPRLSLPGRKLEAGVFISYRRADSAAYAGRLYDYLVDHFHRDRIFVDIEDIAPGANFPEVLNKALESSAVLILVIGPRWLRSEGDDGKRRLDDPDDWVRLEVATAIQRKIEIFPALVGGARMPSADDLPPDIAALALRNESEITDKRWDYDAKKLMNSIRTALAEVRRSS